MEELLNLPADISKHGPQLDNMLGLVHWLMLLLFVGWGTFFIYTLLRFRQSKNPKASYTGVKSKISTFVEGGVVIAEAVLLVAFAIPIWAEIMTEHPSEQAAVRINVVAQQFAWNIHYPGADGVFGRRDISLVNEETNPLGIDRSDSNAVDDIVTLNQLYFPVNKPVLINLSSKDVIHCFSLNEMRVKQDIIPGMSIPISFEAIKTGHFEIACAQLCGIGHYRMRGFYTVQTEEEFNNWLAEQAAQLDQSGEEVW
jgi:cytochrome c oxidase subunit II